MYVVTAPIVKNSNFSAEMNFNFLKKRPGPNWKVFLYQIWTQWRDRKSSYQVRQNLALFYKLVALTLG